MDGKEVKLSVKDLVISFKTANGKVQAVRDISFDLYKGETLAIVGESGSGKSVTTRAMLGILAGNAVKEGGEIIYDGQDLFKIPEENFNTIRGDKIAMIFQDPLSSLNPIMRIGKQMTEAMLIKGKLLRKESRAAFNGTLKLLNENMDAAMGEESREANKLKCRNFDKFEYKHLELEGAYNAAKEAAEEALVSIEGVLYHIEKNALQGVDADIKEIISLAGNARHTYVVCARAEELKALLQKLKALVTVPFVARCKTAAFTLLKRKTGGYARDYAAIKEVLEQVKNILEEGVSFEKPNFFAMGYYLTFCPDPLPEMPTKELNVFLRKYLDDNFMLDFIAGAKQGLIYSREKARENKRKALQVLKDTRALFESGAEKQQLKPALKGAVKAVEDAIDRLEIIKDNTAYTFNSSIYAAVDRYISCGEQQKEGAKADVLAVIDRVCEDFEQKISKEENFDEKTVAVIDYLKEKASGVAYRLTRRMAKTRAIKLLEEVGIPDPARRFRQYPFEFSGGMRQRIVIAIALSANPDVLICDEPTTALDVTIQAQILELINKVKAQRQLSVIFITHDLGVVANMADRVAVMYAGKIVEIGTAKDIFYSPAHPYTWALLSSMPDLNTKEKLEAIPGTPPNMLMPPKGDAFADRNVYAMQIDFEQQPPMFKISETHSAATWLLHPDAPKVQPPKAVTDRINAMKNARYDDEK